MALSPRCLSSALVSCRCCIPNVYAALFSAGLAPLACLVVIFVVFVHAYQVKLQWAAYDDVFRGRTNATGTLPRSGCVGICVLGTNN